MKKQLLILGLILSSLIFLAADIFAQVGVQTLQSRRLLSTSAGAQFWRAGDNQIMQISVPLTFVYPVNEKLLLDITASPAFNSMNTGIDATLGGLSDTRLRGSYLLNERNFLITFGLNLPSGKRSLKVDEFSVASVLAIHALDFQVPVLGQGFEVNSGIVKAFDLNRMVIGVGAGFLFRGPYQPLDGADFDYDPGEEISLSAGVDYDIGRKNKLMMDLSYTLYTTDRIQSKPVFQSGNRLSIQATAYFPGEVWSHLIFLNNRLKGKNQIGSGDLVPERLNSNGNEMDLTAMTLLSYSPRTSFRAAVEGKFYSNNQLNTGGAIVGGMGGGWSRRIGGRLNWDFDCRFYLGRMTTVSQIVNILGVKLSTGVRISM